MADTNPPEAPPEKLQFITISDPSGGKLNVRIGLGGVDKDNKPTVAVALFDGNEKKGDGDVKPITGNVNDKAAFDKLSDQIKSDRDKAKVLFAELAADRDQTIATIARTGKSPQTNGEMITEAAGWMGTPNNPNTALVTAAIDDKKDDREKVKAYHDELALYVDPQTGVIPHSGTNISDANDAAKAAMNDPSKAQNRNKEVDDYLKLVGQLAGPDSKNPVTLDLKTANLNQVKVALGSNINDLSLLEKLTGEAKNELTAPIFDNEIAEIKANTNLSDEQKNAQCRLIEANRIARSAVKAVGTDDPKAIEKAKKALAAMADGAAANGNDELGRTLTTSAALIQPMIDDKKKADAIKKGVNGPNTPAGRENAERHETVVSFRGAAGTDIQKAAEAGYNKAHNLDGASDDDYTSEQQQATHPRPAGAAKPAAGGPATPAATAPDDTSPAENPATPPAHPGATQPNARNGADDGTVYGADVEDSTAYFNGADIQADVERLDRIDPHEQPYIHAPSDPNNPAPTSPRQPTQTARAPWPGNANGSINPNGHHYDFKSTTLTGTINTAPGFTGREGPLVRREHDKHADAGTADQLSGAEHQWNEAGQPMQSYAQLEAARRQQAQPAAAPVVGPTNLLAPQQPAVSTPPATAPAITTATPTSNYSGMSPELAAYNQQYGAHKIYLNGQAVDAPQPAAAPSPAPSAPNNPNYAGLNAGIGVNIGFGLNVGGYGYNAGQPGYSIYQQHTSYGPATIYGPPPIYDNAINRNAAFVPGTSGTVVSPASVQQRVSPPTVFHPGPGGHR